MGYRPRIKRGGTTYDLPLPLMQIGERFSRRVRQTVVPLQDGVFATESTRGALLVSLTGTIIVGNPQDSERSGVATGMVTNIILEKELLETHLIESNDPFVFYRFVSGATIGGSEYNAAAGTVFYKDCYCTDLSFDYSNQTVVYLPYSFSLLVPDGVVWHNR